MEGKVTKIVEELQQEAGEPEVVVRVVTVRVDKPWPGNIYKQYHVRDEAKRFSFGDKVAIEFRKVE